MVLTILLILAGLMGAAGVILAAAGAHAAPTAGLDSAAYLLLFHATAVLGASALAQQGLVADIGLDRWDPSREAWLPPGDTATAELTSGQEHVPARGRLRAVGAVVSAIFDGLGSADF